MTLVCECGSPEIESVDATYPEDVDGRSSGTAFERYECQDCGRTGGFSFGDGVERTHWQRRSTPTPTCVTVVPTTLSCRARRAPSVTESLPSANTDSTRPTTRDGRTSPRTIFGALGAPCSSTTKSNRGS